MAKKSKAREHRLTRDMNAETWVRAPRDPAAIKVRLESEDNGRRLIAAALRAYRGTLVVATHDRALIDALECDQVLEVRDRGLVSSNASARSS